MSFTPQHEKDIKEMKSVETWSDLQKEDGENEVGKSEGKSKENSDEKLLNSFSKSLSNRNDPPVDSLIRLPTSREIYTKSDVQGICDQLDSFDETFKEEIKFSNPKIEELLEVRERQVLEDKNLNSSASSNQNTENQPSNVTSCSTSSQDVNNRSESQGNPIDKRNEVPIKAAHSLFSEANDNEGSDIRDPYQSTQNEERVEDKEFSQSSECSSNAESKNKEKSKANEKEDNKNNESNQNGGFACNICFDTASNPVLTFCGHLYCWPCLHNWLKAQPYKQLCAVCKAGCGKDKVIPVYGRGSDMKDPRLDESIPDRPKGQRPEPTIAPGFRAFESLMTGFGETRSSISYFSMFSTIPTLSFQYNWDGGAPPVGESTPQQAFLSRLFLMVGILFVIANLFG